MNLENKKIFSYKKQNGKQTNDFYKFLSFLKRKIIFVPSDDFISYMPRAIEISPDPDDIQYFALALKAGAILWSNEKRLKNQDKITVLSTSDLIEWLEKEE